MTDNLHKSRAYRVLRWLIHAHTGPVLLFPTTVFLAPFYMVQQRRLDISEMEVSLPGWIWMLGPVLGVMVLWIALKLPGWQGLL